MKGARVGRRKGRSSLSAILIALLLVFSGSSHGHAGERTTIDADVIEYDKDTATYTARGSVKIKSGLATIESEEMTYNEQTGEAKTDKDVLYEDAVARVKAKGAELNLDLNTGKLFQAEIFTKKDKYRIIGNEIEKEGDDEYSLRSATFTTCDGPVPAWCFKGKDVDVTVGDRVRARGATFNILDVPVFYTPYMSTSLDKERKTGFLSPGIGYVKSKGLHYEQPFFWNIAENRDLTVFADYYSKRGIGQGLEYRFVEPDNSKGDFFAYHIWDRDFQENFWGFRGLYDRERDRPVTGYLSLNYVNSKNFYDDYVPYIMNHGKKFLDSTSYLNTTTGRFLESVGEGMLGFDSGRLFMTAQYLVDLKQGTDSSTIAQTLPEVGVFINPRPIGPILFSFSSTLANYWRDEGARGQRLDIYPQFSYAFGSDVIITQNLGLRETAYLLSGSDEFGDTPHRESFNYSIVARTRLMKRYDTFIHIVEPSLSYTFIPPAGTHLPLFDSTELYTKTSAIELSLLNRFIDAGGEFLTLRLTQAYDADLGDQPFLPLKIDLAIQRPFSFRGEATYGIETGKVETVNSDIGIVVRDNTRISMGERYNRLRDILFYTVAGNYSFTKELSAEGNFWYDAKSHVLGNLIAKVKYQKQCWGMTMVFTKRQSDFSVNVLFDLLGLGTVKI